ncbi:peptidoglycan recognition protein family protein [Methylorubrum extorquens]|uniref:N-acetylmuramoyl-L-alanine amidase family 2 n=1 Tax=Methylorubrum extorquens (strain CM4 / NCIMB 13688) TaxID=440085 RepID=B7KW07_METC4|nr:peptidoglycan recognition family protein [Methylorubrum extorquens]ACK82823.1 N-acetylmuramoyl-L-alanine amidase family 2 [Methylorubrum extorquens CM4]
MGRSTVESYNEVHYHKDIIRYRCMIILFAVTFSSTACAEEGVQIISRESWGANPATKPMADNKPVHLTIHHTGVRAKASINLQAKLTSLQKFSQSSAVLADGRVKSAWADVPYHYYIAVDGLIAEGRMAKYVGDSNTIYNLQGHLSIVLEGNFEHESPTENQVRSLESLLTKLSRTHSIDSSHIGAHKQYAKTACPGKKLLEILPKIKNNVSVRLASPQP